MKDYEGWRIMKDEGLWRMKDYKGLEWEKFSMWGHAWDYEGLWRMKDYKGLEWEKFSVWGHV